MGQTHYVKQGEYLAQIARSYGFADYKTIWDAPENSDLKEKRKNPNVLFPGDKLFIPDRETREESRATEARHKFELQGEPLQLRIVLLGLNNKPLQGHECTLNVEGESKEITTKSDGLLKREIPTNAATGRLLDRGKPGPQVRAEREIPLKIGHLDPVDTLSGQKARLNNLGYNAGDPAAPPAKPEEEEARARQFQSALEEFQCDFGLQVDGICGKHTQHKLLEVHGC